MKVQSSRFGALTVDDNKLISFPKGIPGFEDSRRFFLLDHPGNVRVKWLHSADDPGLALVVANPFELFADYQPEVPEEIVGMLGARGPEDMLVLTVLSVHRGNPPKVTANLLAPIVICHGTMRGVQVMMKAGKYGVRHEVELLQKNFKAGPKSSAG
jgi:flagellar assembly factor FliW